MDFSMVRSERITAVISTVIAVVILAGGVTAYQARTAPVEDIVQLESDLRFQLEVGFMHDHRERAARLRQLEQVTAAWRESAQASTDRTTLAEWLLEATIRSMPGSTQALPPTPAFGAAAVPPTADAVAIAEPIAPAEAESTDRLSADRHDVFVDPQPDAPFVPAVEPPTPAVFDPAEDAASDGSSESQVGSTLMNKPSIAIVAKPQFRPRETPPVVVAAATPVVPVEPIRVNLSELAARIAGYHAGLDEVELALSRLEVDNFETLTVQVREVEQLTRVYQFVSLYYESLDGAERRWVEAPRPVASTLEKLQDRIDRAQESQSSDFLGEFDANRPNRIGRLRQQVSKLVSAVSR
ncbi:MAG: hypothetical protein AAGD11_05080 [Planctomycetota bacterium]